MSYTHLYYGPDIMSYTRLCCEENLRETMAMFCSFNEFAQSINCIDWATICRLAHNTWIVQLIIDCIAQFIDKHPYFNKICDSILEPLRQSYGTAHFIIINILV